MGWTLGTDWTLTAVKNFSTASELINHSADSDHQIDWEDFAVICGEPFYNEHIFKLEAWYTCFYKSRNYVFHNLNDTWNVVWFFFSLPLPLFNFSAFLHFLPLLHFPFSFFFSVFHFHLFLLFAYFPSFLLFACFLCFLLLLCSACDWWCGALCLACLSV